jgi:predicted xylose isomerase-like sugar epimerase
MLSDHPDNERYLTYGDKELQDFYNTLEENGVNTVEIRRRISGDQSTYDVQKQKANRKENKRIESALVNRINNLSKNDKFKKLVSKAEKKLEEYRKNDNS